MIIDFVQIQKQKFEVFANKIMAEPTRYVDFESISDFYKVTWLNHFPKGTTWYVSGLDDGADDFYIQIEYQGLYFQIDVQSHSILFTFQNKKVVINKYNDSL